MRASEIVKELQHIIETVGDLEVDISVAKQPKVLDTQNYLVADATFVVLDEFYEDDETEKKRIMIRDWPY